MRQAFTNLIYVLVMIIVLMVANLSIAKAQSIQFKDLETIVEAAQFYNIPPEKLLKIAYVESHFKTNAIRRNKNGTTDIGMFQINSIHWTTTCAEFNVYKLEGNSLCAAKLISMHRAHKLKDPQWVARYHSKTPSLKNKYFQKLQNVPQIKVAHN